MSNILNFPYPLRRKPQVSVPTTEEVKGVYAAKTEGTVDSISQTNLVTFLPLMRLLDRIRNLNVITNTPNYIHPILRYVATPVAILGAVYDIGRTAELYESAGCDSVTVSAMAMSRTSYQLVNNFLLPGFTFKLIMKTMKNAKFSPYVAAAGAIGVALAGSPLVSTTFDKIAINQRLKLRNYQYVAPNTNSGYDNFFGASKPVLPSSEFLPAYPNFMLLESAPLYEADSVLGAINMHTVGNVRRMGQGGLTNADGMITGIPAPTKGTDGRNTDAFGDYALSSLYERQLDYSLGLVQPKDLSDSSKAQMLENVKNLYNKLN